MQVVYIRGGLNLSKGMCVFNYVDIRVRVIHHSNILLLEGKQIQ